MSLKVTWFGHGAFGLEIGEDSVLIDPFLSDCPTAAVQPEDVDADFILISHGHGDHVGDAIQIANRTGAKVISNAEIAGWFSNQGIESHAQHIGGGYKHPFGYLKLTQALHGSGLPDGSYGGNPAGFLLTVPEGEKVYFACDTGLFPGMQFIGEEGIELAFLPIGDNFTMGPDDALRAVRLIQPKHVVPVHYDTWGLIAQDPHAWAERVRGETQSEPHVLEPGESFGL